MNINKKMVRYKNEMLKLRISDLNSTELKVFMAICGELKNLQTNTIILDYLTLKKITNCDHKTNDEFTTILKNISESLFKVLYISETPKIHKYHVFFEKFIIDENTYTLTVNMHPEMAYLLNDWSGGEWSQFSLDTFNKIKGFAAKQLFRILIQYNGFKKAIINMEDAQLIMGCYKQRNNDFINRTIPNALKQFEELGIILPGWKYKAVKKNNFQILHFNYVMPNEIKKIAKKKILNIDNIKDPFVKAKATLLKEQGESDGFILAYVATNGNYEKTKSYYDFIKRHPEIEEYLDVVDFDEAMAEDLKEEELDIEDIFEMEDI